MLRGAIEAYAAQNQGTYPGTDETSFKAALGNYIRGQFPTCPVGASGIAGTNGVSVVSGASTVLAGSGDASPAKAFKYNYTTGEIIINYHAADNAGVFYDAM